MATATALVAIEPSGAPERPRPILASSKACRIIVWGDFRDKVAIWRRLPIAPTKYREALVAASGKADVFDLPVIGVRGDQHAGDGPQLRRRHQLIHDWIVKHGW